jgi:hypothetical protein
MGKKEIRIDVRRVAAGYLRPGTKMVSMRQEGDTLVVGYEDKAAMQKRVVKP